jgi:hydrogenase assembly chaperone HypC/HupF
MCIDYPGVVVEIVGSQAVVETRGRRRAASTLLVPDLSVGDCVTVAAGTVVARLSPTEANEIRRLLDAATQEGATS